MSTENRDRAAELGALLSALLDAAAATDADELAQLCEANASAIEAQFPQWRTVPAEIRDDPSAMQRYAQGLIAVAQHFALHRQQPALLQLLMGEAADNPMLKWQEMLVRVRDLMQALEYAKAAEILGDLLAEARNMRGDGVAHFLPLTFGWLGECWFQMGRLADGIGPTEQALQLCEHTNQEDGVIVYRRNLFEMHRYLGEKDAAAEYADALVTALYAARKTDEANYYREVARVVRAGEPLARVVARIDGQVHELDELPKNLEGNVSFSFVRNRMTLRRALEALDRGRQLGNSGEFERALAEFRSAAEADPFDPDPHYLAGLTLLHLGRFAEAVEEYDRTEALAPAWYNCRSDRWLAAQIAAGALPPSVFDAMRVLEDGEMPAVEKIALARELVAHHPTLSLVHLFLGIALAGEADEGADDEAQRTAMLEEARTAFETGLRYADDPDTRTRLLVHWGMATSDAATKRDLFGRAASLNGNLIAGAMAQVALASMQSGDTPASANADR